MSQGFFSAVKTAAASPFGVVAFIGLLVAWAYVKIAQYRLERISKIIKAVPEQDRAGCPTLGFLRVGRFSAFCD